MSSIQLLKPAVNQTAYAKIGILGFAGSGKSFTGTDLAIGLAKLSKGKSVAFFDTEKGSDFMIKKVRESGLELLVHRGRSFMDLVTIIKDLDGSKETPVLIIDSITHIWRDLCDSYAKKMNKKRLSMMDWNILKGQWKEYTDKFINSSLHMVMLGRAGYEYDMFENDDGKKEMIKTGTKMKVEGETGFEPDLLIEMDRVEAKDKIINRAWVMKDRNQALNGKFFDYPSFEMFQSFF